MGFTLIGLSSGFGAQACFSEFRIQGTGFRTYRTQPVSGLNVAAGQLRVGEEVDAVIDNFD